jgi:hypothetical protein
MQTVDQRRVTVRINLPDSDSGENRMPGVNQFHRGSRTYMLDASLFDNEGRS